MSTKITRYAVVLLCAGALLLSGCASIGTKPETRSREDGSVLNRQTSSLTDPFIPSISETEFLSLANELSRKVNLFREVWSQQPDAFFTGGTSRDFLYWVKGNLIAAKSPEELETVIARLRSYPVIDVRSFILEQSDVDIVGGGVHIAAEKYGVAKVDTISADRFDASSVLGKSEVDQGYLATEKILLGRERIYTPSHFGNGVHEIFIGKPTVHFSAPEVFRATHYASQHLNHPILLVTRYFRILSVNYSRHFGNGAVTPDLIDSIPPETERQIRETIAGALKDGELGLCMQNERFKKWFNDSVEKAFRAYVNPTATYALFQHYGLDRLLARYKDSPPIHQFLFAESRLPRDLAEFRSRFESLGFREEDLLVPVRNKFPDLKIYHGTKTEGAFADIILRGIIASSGGSAGKGLYGVTKPNSGYAEKWGGSPQRLLSIEIQPDARMVDATTSSAKALYAAYARRFPESASWEAFYSYFGIDLVRYPYDVEAFVVKNSSVLSKPKGVYRSVLTYSEAYEQASSVKTPIEILSLLRSVGVVHNYTVDEKASIYERVASSVELKRYFHSIKTLDVEPRFKAAGYDLGLVLEVLQGVTDEEMMKPYLFSGIYEQILASLAGFVPTRDRAPDWKEFQAVSAQRPLREYEHLGNTAVPDLKRFMELYIAAKGKTSADSAKAASELAAKMNRYTKRLQRSPLRAYLKSVIQGETGKLDFSMTGKAGGNAWIAGLGIIDALLISETMQGGVGQAFGVMLCLTAGLPTWAIRNNFMTSESRAVLRDARDWNREVKNVRAEFKELISASLENAKRLSDDCPGLFEKAEDAF